MHIAALVLGILGVVLFWIPVVGWLGVVLGLVALILGIVAAAKGQKTFGMLGIILGAVSFIGGLVIQIMTILAVGAAVDVAEDFQSQLNLPVQQAPTDNAPFQ